MISRSHALRGNADLTRQLPRTVNEAERSSRKRSKSTSRRFRTRGRFDPYQRRAAPCLQISFHASRPTFCILYFPFCISHFSLFIFHFFHSLSSQNKKSEGEWIHAFGFFCMLQGTVEHRHLTSGSQAKMRTPECAPEFTTNSSFPSASSQPPRSGAPVPAVRGHDRPAGPLDSPESTPGQKSRPESHRECTASPP